ncbi:DNA-binding response regulator [Prauserella marina]|uniref:DNA-binding response regulator, NarL/FixJ family, contains REC and HTH domains n=1 Tax=Prauserella marina TaxID=530584 RepID=A0A222VIT7_9PSEU|nr:response regulator transcription factor [Prauserella marina]ASR33742.1 DNA-binding response regulator [Prauserella marina]PWV82310.1 LuxR family two component transcriptional regulator [Prauserella marina]SDC65960.1 DNA-binding response regulator, NarL/FixJ family, contains REC and HTH domains [Prauserella marina]
MAIEVLLVDDHEVVRRGLRELLTDERDIEVVAEASSADEALAVAMHVEPDVAVVDVRLGDGEKDVDGVALCRELRSRPNPPQCLVLTAFDDEEAMMGAIMAGASGYLLKQVRGQDVVNAVREVAAGRSLLDPVTTARLLDKMRHPAESDRLAELSERERSVLDLIGHGMSNREIAERLFLAEKTVKNYVTSLLGKLGMQRRTQAAAWVARRGTRDH